MDNPTITPETMDAYRKRAGQLLHKAAKALGILDWEKDAMACCIVIGNERRDLKPVAWRQYRAALYRTLSEMAFQDEADYILGLDESPCKGGTGRTSALKMKSIPVARREELFYELRQGVHVEAIDELIYKWLYLGILTGLRPIEWRSATFDGKVLHVRNAKHTNGRAPGPTRDINFEDDVLYDVSDDILVIIDALNGEKYEAQYHACRDRLRKVNKRLWPKAKKTITLYSARHQCVADNKNLITRAELAALLGHSNLSTASRYYAPRAAGTLKNGKVRPSQENVLQVRRRNESNNKRSGKSPKPKIN